MTDTATARIPDKADLGLAILDGLADKWADDVDLTSMIKAVTTPMGLNPSAPMVVRESFRRRMEEQFYAIARQAFIEGAYRAITGFDPQMRNQT